MVFFEKPSAAYLSGRYGVLFLGHGSGELLGEIQPVSALNGNDGSVVPIMGDFLYLFKRVSPVRAMSNKFGGGRIRR